MADGPRRRAGPRVTPRADLLDDEARVAPLGRRARPQARGRGAVHAGRMTAKTSGAPRARLHRLAPAFHKDAAVAHELGPERKLAHHRGAFIEGGAAMALGCFPTPGAGTARGRRAPSRGLHHSRT